MLTPLLVASLLAALSDGAPATTAPSTQPAASSAATAGSAAPQPAAPPEAAASSAPAVPAGDLPPPVGFHVEYQPRTRWAVVGGISFGAAYLTEVGMALGSSEGGGPGSNPATYIPVAGAFILGVNTFQEIAPLFASGSCGDLHSLCLIVGVLGGTLALLELVDGAVQVGGLGLAIAGLVTRDRVFVADKPTARLIPLAVPHGGGIALAGTY